MRCHLILWAIMRTSYLHFELTLNRTNSRAHMQNGDEPNEKDGKREWKNKNDVVVSSEKYNGTWTYNYYFQLKWNAIRLRGRNCLQK